MDTPKTSKENSALELVVFVGGEEQKFSLPAEGDITIGREADNDVVLNDSSVSRYHAMLHVGSSLSLIDRGSSNGTVVQARSEVTASSETRKDNGLSGGEFTVKPGDYIRFGSLPAVVRSRRAADTAATVDSRFILHDPVMIDLYEEARRLASSTSRACVLILGETGVGKEELANAIHLSSPRSKKRFVAVNCAAFSEQLFENEVFGHEKGAFTGATSTRKGSFELAHGGTLFLDEIGELSLPLQAKLLRVLEKHEVQRIGNPEPIPVDVRVVAATNKDLEACIERGTFRRDLYHRLRGFQLYIPPLRERPTEILPLAELFLAKECKANSIAVVPTISPEAAALLTGFDYPGNVRQLHNAMHEASLRCTGSVLRREHLPHEISGLGRRPLARKGAPESHPSAMTEKERFEDALRKCGGNQRRAAEMLGIPLRTFVSKLDKLPIPRPKKGH